jgi:hypothetical protein
VDRIDLDLAECRADPGGLSVGVAGEKDETDSKDIYAWFSAARTEIMRDRSLTKEQRKGKIAALKAQRALKVAARKADKVMRKLRSMKKMKGPKPQS